MNHYAEEPKRIKYLEAYRTWKALVDNHNAMELTVLDLLAHPEATDGQIDTVRARLIERRQVMRELYPVVCEKLNRLRVIAFAIPRPKFMEARS